jgi:hypothetical protein
MTDSADLPSTSSPSKERLVPFTSVPHEADIERPPSNQAVETLIPYRNPASLLSYYLGIFSLIPLVGILLALPALLCGIIGLVKVSKEPARRGMAHAIAGIIFGILGSYNYIGLYLFVSWAWFTPPPPPNNFTPPPIPGQFPYWG